MIKRILTLGLTLIMGLSTATVTNAQETTEISKSDYVTTFNINDKSSLKTKARLYDMPTEVEEYVKDIFTKNKKYVLTDTKFGTTLL